MTSPSDSNNEILTMKCLTTSSDEFSERSVTPVASTGEQSIMTDRDVRNMMREVKLAGGCSNPVRVKSDLVDRHTGEVSSRSLRLACKDRRTVICPSCSATYQKDAWILVSTGLVGGKGVSEAVSGHPRLFMTLTAPSFGAVHTITDRGTPVAAMMKT